MLLRKVKETVNRYHLLTQGDRVVVGVSGGVDSMVLLRLLHGLREDFKLALIVAHINHGLRPDESEREAELVREESVRLGLPFEYGRFDAKTFSRTAGFSLQDGARRLRYHFFQGLLLKHQAQKIALGHHADDQVETFLSRLIRGSGLRGLRGMLPMRDQTVIRPLLEAWKEEIVSFASQERVPYLHDSSNLKEDYLRNRLRLHLIPLLEKNYQSNFRKRILKTSALLREEDDCLEEEAKNAYNSLVQEEENGLAFRFSEFQSYRTPIQRRVVQGLLHKVYGETTAEHPGIEGFPDAFPDARQDALWSATGLVYDKLRHAAASFLLTLPHDMEMEKRYDRVVLRKGRIKPIPPFEVELEVPGRTLIGETGHEIHVEIGEINGHVHSHPECGNFALSASVAFLDYQVLQLPLRIRNFRPGDRFHPLGSTGEQKLKQFFIDHKIPRLERPGIVLLVSGERIVWVVGHRIDERAKITEKTTKVLRVEARHLQDGGMRGDSL